MKKSIFTKILCLVLLTTLFIVGCTQEEAEEMPDWNITVTPVNEAYSGETSTVEVKVSKSCVIKLLVDGAEKKSATGTALSYDVSALPAGTHSIKVSVDDGSGVYEKSFSCRIVDKPKTYQKPTLTCQKVTEAYLGEHYEIVASTKTDSKITLYVDGVEKTSSSTQSLKYDVAGLAIGTHAIKIVAVNGDKKDEVSFDCVISKKQVVINYDYVDLGLPSGTLWATTNVGAENPWDDGDYFAWGETEPKDYYDWDTYKYCKGTEKSMTKYCDKSDYGYNGFTDNLTVLLPEDDAATVNMGSEWRMPMIEEFYELISECDWEWTNNYNGTGVAGRIVKSKKNSNHIFIPAIGFGGYYWTSSLYDPCVAYGMYYTEEDVYNSVGYERRYKRQVRAVRVEKTAPAKVEIEMSMPSSPMTEGEKYMVYCKVNRNCGIIFYIDDNQACTEIPGTPNGFYWQLSAYKAGTHTLTARSYIDGNVVAEKSTTYTVEAKPQPISADYVDLGLPSGTLWATRNVGAENPWDYGDYFAWGETEPKEVCDWDNYTASDAPSPLDAAHDAATANWGINWRMPTKDEYQELLDNCEWEWTNDYNGTGVHGYIVWDTYFHKTHIFLPSGGYRHGADLYYAGSDGYYWSSTVYDSDYAWELGFDSGNPIMYGNGRYYGRSVRPVRCR